jgi:hypothetical protein
MRAGDKWELGFKGKTFKEHAFTSNEWQLLSMVVMATNKIYYYKNGIGSTGTVTLVPTNAFAPDYVPAIGRMGGTTVPDYNFRGLIDEFQMSSVARSADWVWACWMNQGGSNGEFQICGQVTSNAPPPVDNDHDLLADAWEIQYFGDTNATGGGASEDKDGDGVNNLYEYIAGTDPTTNTSCLVIEIGKYGGNMAIIYDALEATGTAYSGKDRYYDLEDCSNLPPNSWTPVSGQSDIRGDGSEKNFTNLPPGDLRRFYRVKARLLP